MKAPKRILQLAVYTFIFLSSLPSYARKYDINMMAPLYANSELEFSQFETQLTELKKTTKDENIGISVDVWWGIVEPKDNEFHWDYYDKIFTAIQKKGFKIIPIMSFHKCGGNVNDNINIPLPHWIWTLPPSDNTDLLYLSENNNYTQEYVSLWKDGLIRNQYREFLSEFKNHFSKYKDHFKEIIISCGPSGEIRYPSYNSHDHWEWPRNHEKPLKPGYFQWYSEPAIRSFQEWTHDHLGSPEDIQKRWNDYSITQITPPTNIDYFKNTQDYKKTTYGKDIINWYNDALINHAIFMLNIANDVFSDEYNIPFGVKLPGIHWYADDKTSDFPRLAEAAAGLINFEDPEKDGHGYSAMIENLATFNKNTHPIVLHFTCIEMSDHQDGYSHSKPRTLVQWIGETAHSNNLPLKGENALKDSVDKDFFWENIRNALDHHHFEGVTFLRLSDVIANTSKLQKYFPDNCKPPTN
jgi:hypothetical protein